MKRVSNMAEHEMTSSIVYFMEAKRQYRDLGDHMILVQLPKRRMAEPKIWPRTKSSSRRLSARVGFAWDPGRVLGYFLGPWGQFHAPARGHGCTTPNRVCTGQARRQA